MTAHSHFTETDIRCWGGGVAVSEKEVTCCARRYLLHYFLTLYAQKALLWEKFILSDYILFKPTEIQQRWKLIHNMCIMYLCSKSILEMGYQCEKPEIQARDACSITRTERNLYAQCISLHSMPIFKLVYSCEKLVLHSSEGKNTSIVVLWKCVLNNKDHLLAMTIECIYIVQRNSIVPQNI